MARSQESSNKKEVRNKKEKKRKEKEKKRLEKKANAKEGKSLDDMIAYVDENGRITSTPPEERKKASNINVEDIQIGVPRRDDTERNNPNRKGVVTFFNESKGFGFIKDSENQQSVFIHANGLIDPVKENSRVTFNVQQGARGPVGVNVKLDK